MCGVWTWKIPSKESKTSLMHCVRIEALKKLGVSLSSFQGDSLVSDIFEAIVETNIAAVELYENRKKTGRLPLEAMAEVVCREDC